MPIPLRVLILEDRPTDAELILHELRQAGFDPEWQRVETEEEYLTALHPALEIILSDYSLPHFDGLSALRLLRARGLDLPFIIVSGTIGEDIAVSAMKEGADDYLLKDRMARLGQAVAKALEAKHLRDEKGRADELLRQTQARLKDILENAAEAIVTHGRDGIIIFNHAAEKMFGYTAKEILGQPLDLLIPEPMVEIHHKHVQDFAASTQQVRPMEYRHDLSARRKDGNVFPAEIGISKRVEFGENLYTAIIVDITERKQAEEALKLFRTLIDRSNDAIEILDPETGQFLDINEKGCLDLGYSREEFLTLNVYDIDPMVNQSVFSSTVEELKKSGVLLWESSHRRKDGSTFPVEVNIKYIQLDREYIVTVARDITERKQAELTLRKSEENYRRILNGVDEIIYEINLLERSSVRGTVEFVSQRTQEALGYRPDEFITDQNLWFSLIHPDDIPALQSQGAMIMKTGQPGSLKYRIRDINGEYRWLEDKVSPEIDQTGRVVRTFGVARDITERKQAEEALREKEHLLSEAQHIGHIGSWRYDIPRDALQFSDEMYRLLDVSADEFSHNLKTFLDLIYPEDRTSAEKWMEELMAGRLHRELGFRVFHKNYELRHLHGRGEVAFDANGHPASLIGTAQDVTENKLAEIQIRQQLERLTALRNIDQAITSSFNLRSTLNTFLSQVIAQLHVDAADVLLLDADGQTLTYAASQGFRTKAIEVTSVGVGDSHAGRAAKERRLIRIENLKDPPHNRLLTTLPADEEFVCYYGAPLIAKGEVKGVLEVFHRTPLHPYPEWIDFLNTLAGQAAIAIDNASLFEQLQTSNSELTQAYDVTIEGWSRAMDLRDKETEGHTQRVTKLTERLARAMDINEAGIIHIRRGALLHDIGKMGVPDGILFKPDKLTDAEWVLVKKHPQFAYDMLSPIAYLRPALDIPYCHHEKWDGTGYPQGLEGEQIPLAARIFALADVYDALTSDRPYRKAWSKEKTREYIFEQSGKHFDPQMVAAFLKMLAEGRTI